MDSAMEIGDRLRQLRIALGYSQAKAFCDWIGMGDTTWNNFERGHRRITINEAMKVVTKTGVSLDWIYRGLESTLPKHVADKLDKLKPEATPKRASNG